MNNKTKNCLTNKLTSESLDKVNSCMRSIYRLNILQESKFTPDIMIDNEVNILKKRLADLNKEEIMHLSLNIVNYLESQKLKSAMDDEFMARDFKNYLLTLN
jgi:hypothetical protein